MFVSLEGEGPAYRRIYRQIRQAILDGGLAPGARLPATRRLAGQLGVARVTVVQAYEQLAAEGYLEARPGSGTRVAEALRGALAGPAPKTAATPPRLAGYAERSLVSVPDGQPGISQAALRWDFQYSRPEVPAGLRADWRWAVRRVVDNFDVEYPDPRGVPVLRECLATFLRDRRGILVDPDRIMVVTGAQQALELIGRCILEPGDPVVMEDPHYQGARHVFQALGAQLLPIPVDDNGLQTGRFSESGDNTDGTAARLAYVTPSHQFPLGGVLPAHRRLALLKWADRQDAYIIEDDYDSEYRHEGAPLQSLHSLDNAGRVFYLGTLSKLLFPALRLGYVVIPPAWVEAMRQVKWLADRGNPALEQRALVELFRTGALRRHINRTARKLARRRQTLVRALEENFAHDVRILGTRSGVHLVTRWPELPRDLTTGFAARAATYGAGVYPTAPYYAGDLPEQAELLLGYAGLDRIGITDGVMALRRAYRKMLSHTESIGSGPARIL